MTHKPSLGVMQACDYSSCGCFVPAVSSHRRGIRLLTVWSSLGLQLALLCLLGAGSAAVGQDTAAPESEAQNLPVSLESMAHKVFQQLQVLAKARSLTSKIRLSGLESPLEGAVRFNPRQPASSVRGESGLEPLSISRSPSALDVQFVAVRAAVRGSGTAVEPTQVEVPLFPDPGSVFEHYGLATCSAATGPFCAPSLPALPSLDEFPRSMADFGLNSHTTAPWPRAPAQGRKTVQVAAEAWLRQQGIEWAGASDVSGLSRAPSRDGAELRVSLHRDGQLSVEGDLSDRDGPGLMRLAQALAAVAADAELSPPGDQENPPQAHPSQAGSKPGSGTANGKHGHGAAADEQKSAGRRPRQAQAQAASIPAGSWFSVEIVGGVQIQLANAGSRRKWALKRASSHSKLFRVEQVVSQTYVQRSIALRVEELQATARGQLVSLWQGAAEAAEGEDARGLWGQAVLMEVMTGKASEGARRSSRTRAALSSSDFQAAVQDVLLHPDSAAVLKALQQHEEDSLHVLVSLDVTGWRKTRK